MNTLSIQAINARASYQVTEAGAGCYQFFTDLSAIVSEFTTTISLLSTKPD